MAKEALMKTNKLYDFFEKYEWGLIYQWCFRIFFVILWAIFNIKMIEYKIKSFAKIGASFTVIVAFFSNYIFSLGYEIILNNNYPGKNDALGSIIIILGIYFLQQDEADSNKKRAKEVIIDDGLIAQLSDDENQYDLSDDLIKSKKNVHSDDHDNHQSKKSEKASLGSFRRKKA